MKNNLKLKVMQNFGGWRGGGANTVHYGSCPSAESSLTEQGWSRKDLFYGQIIVVLIHNGCLNVI